jgi:hypothetical protein
MKRKQKITDTARLELIERTGFAIRFNPDWDYLYNRWQIGYGTTGPLIGRGNSLRDAIDHAFEHLESIKRIKK